jgi:hypothetical protein
VTAKGAVLLAFLLTLAGPEPAAAEHEVYYRYTVLGYVSDAAAARQSGVEVELVREKTGFSYLAQTDQNGLYVIVARLGDESAGEKLRLRTAGRTTTIIARFDPANHIRERGTRVDFIAGAPVETPTTFAATLERFLSQ